MKFPCQFGSYISTELLFILHVSCTLGGCFTHLVLELNAEIICLTSISRLLSVKHVLQSGRFLNSISWGGKLKKMRYLFRIVGSIGFKHGELLPDIIPVLISALKDETPAVSRQAITCGIDIFRCTLVKVAIQVVGCLGYEIWTTHELFSFDQV